MPLLNYILIWGTLGCTVSVAAGKKEIVALEIKLPSFVNSILGIDRSLKTFRATLGSKDSDINSLALALTASNQSAPGGDKYNIRSTPDRSLMKVNLVGVNDVAAAFQTYVQPFMESGSESVLDNFKNILMRSTQETKPNVELAPGAIKSEIVTYPPNFLEKKLKFLMKLKEKEEADEQNQNNNE